MAGAYNIPDHERLPNDWYPTPRHAVLPLVPFLPQEPFTFMNPCAGMGHGIARLAEEVPQGLCTAAFWIDGNGFDVPRQAPGPGKVVYGCSWDSSNLEWPGDAEMVITNPVYDWKWLTPLLRRAVEDGRPSWWLIPSDKLFTNRWAEFNPHARLTVPVGRVKWFPGSPASSTKNYVWTLLDPKAPGEHRFETKPKVRRVDLDEQFESSLNPSDLVPATGYWADEMEAA